jgi:pimeloyl-ACP methyl ester carboxylesterase
MRYLWLHGFASGPTSSKGQFVRARLREQGHDLLLPDLNEPAFFDLTVSRMLSQIDRLVPAASADDGQVILFGSSLGGFTAAHWAASRPGRTRALVLLAPAFDLAARWAARMDPSELARWEATGRFSFDHYAHGRKEDLGYAFLADARRYHPYPLPDCPTLVVQGTRDDVVDPSLAREFVRRMGARATLALVDEGHELNADLPALWARIDSFLRAPPPVR